MHKRIAVVGSRDYKYRADVVDYIYSLPLDVIIVSGGARGVDGIAAAAGRERMIDVDIYHANWTLYGKKAGYLRNVQMVDNCDEVVAFWDGKSRGTSHTISIARKKNKPVTVYTYTNRYNNGLTGQRDYSKRRLIRMPVDE